VVAPDYPGFGYSDRPDVAAFEYSFANSDARWTVIPTQGGH
jgi:pimeloyl-ACP methyl ester carboxylesterase